MIRKPQMPAMQKTIFANFIRHILARANGAAKTSMLGATRRLYFADDFFRSSLDMSLYRQSFVVHLLCALMLTMFGSAVFAETPAGTPRFLVSFPKERSAEPLDGRILLLLSTDGSAEPRTQISIS